MVEVRHIYITVYSDHFDLCTIKREAQGFQADVGSFSSVVSQRTDMTVTVLSSSQLHNVSAHKPSRTKNNLAE